MRIIAGRWRGRALSAPPGLTTRPTSDRARQAIFDQLWHAPWAGRAVVENAVVLDAFAQYTQSTALSWRLGLSNVAPLDALEGSRIDTGTGLVSQTETLNPSYLSWTLRAEMRF